MRSGITSLRSGKRQFRQQRKVDRSNQSPPTAECEVNQPNRTEWVSEKKTEHSCVIFSFAVSSLLTNNRSRIRVSIEFVQRKRKKIRTFGCQEKFLHFLRDFFTLCTYVSSWWWFRRGRIEKIDRGCSNRISTNSRDFSRAKLKNRANCWETNENGWTNNRSS